MSNKTRIASTVLGLVLVLAGSKANATLISIDQALDVSVTFGTPYTSSFNLISEGFTPGPQTISWAYASFSIRDSDMISEIVTVSLGGSTLASGLSNPFGFQAFGGFVTGSAYFQLNSSGILDYTVSLLPAPGGNGSGFKLKGASLLADVTGNAAVPDGGSTIALLGGAMLGLGWARKKLFA